MNQENSVTEEQRQKVIDWIYTTVMPVLVPGGRFIYLGNTWHMDDLVARLMKDPQFQYKRKLPAILHDSNRMDLWAEWAKHILDESVTVEERMARANAYHLLNRKEMDDGVQVLWPSRFSYADLYLKRISNPFSFSRMYQCDPSNRPNQKFKDEWLEEAIRKGASLRLQKASRPEFVMEVTTEGVDLAISEDSQSDDTAFLILDRVKYTNHPLIKVGDIIIRNIERG